MVGLGLAMWVALAEGIARADVIVVPNSLQSVEGNSNAANPFVGVGPSRYQQVYAASQFASLVAPLFITQIAFRSDGLQEGAFSFTIANIQINFSTTPAGPDGLSTTLSNNVGSDDTIVFSGPLSLFTSTSGQPVPRPFDFAVPLQTPFLYNPDAGNLLLDVRNFSGGGPFWLFDNQHTGGDPVSRVWVELPGSTPFLVVDTIGMVTQFTATLVPEPGTLLLVGAGLSGLATWRARRGNGRGRG